MIQKAAGFSSSGSETFIPYKEATIVGMVSRIVSTVRVLIVAFRLLARIASVAERTF